MALPEITPTVDVPQDEAVQGLTGFELIEFKKVLKVASLEHAGDIDAIYATVYLYEKRQDETVKYEDVLNRTLHEVTSYFAPPSADPGKAE